jgi:hypothetical protein
MTEAEWITCNVPGEMWQSSVWKRSSRKESLFAVACFRRISQLFIDEMQDRAVTILEDFADGNATPESRKQARHDVWRCIPAWPEHTETPVDDPHFIATMLFRALFQNHEATHAISASAGLADSAPAIAEQARLFRDIFGNPFRPVTFDPAWQTNNVASLAQAIYDERAFDRMPILADALEDAGCTNPDVLNHCRQPGEHVRGCWVVDLLLGKS